MPKILLDFDYTLFDVEKFKDALYKAMRPYMENKSHKFWQEEKRKVQSERKGYDPKKHIALIVPDKKDRKKAEAAVEKTIKTAKKYLYKDTDWFFKKYKDYDLHIVTFGFDKFQKEKIKATGLDKLAKVTITKGRKAPYFNKILKGKQPVVFIDDKGDEIDAAKTRYPRVVCYWMRRPGGKFLDMPCRKYDHKITNLKIKL
ncbi:hypothetical protein KKC88_00865 [Patescibacteria group bacterium]|nr:hypothetical protein [Patescibacteria group bacterium]MBU1673310.1 hypothetical protein [Patescibacteria group bacterium]MBU1963571.1 hypothetical protein [Patescibacteria group bacterium]